MWNRNHIGLKLRVHRDIDDIGVRPVIGLNVIERFLHKLPKLLPEMDVDRESNKSSFF